ncbi:MAG: DUF3017 domain-containing protein [Nocardioides sp.]|nr:DUF3017 domain-containing protein [Nocardioides sp.]
MSSEEQPEEVPAENSPEERVLAADRSVTELKKPSTLGGVLYLCVLVVALFGVGLAASGRWRGGVTWLGGALLAAAAARLVLPKEDAGMLEVRRKVIDIGILVVMGGALIFLAVTIPDQPG